MRAAGCSLTRGMHAKQGRRAALYKKKVGYVAHRERERCFLRAVAEGAAVATIDLVPVTRE